MKHLSAPQIQELREQLVQRKADLLRLDRSRREDRQEVDLEPRDPEELASEDELRVRVAKLGEHQRAEYQEVQAALQRIQSGSYGVCEDSGEEISFARLQIAPTTRYCAEIQAELEEEAQRKQRIEGTPDIGAY